MPVDQIREEDTLLARVHVAQADVDDARGREAGLNPGEGLDGPAEAEEEGDGHAVDVTCVVDRKTRC